MNSSSSVKRILVLAANPQGTNPLSLHKEVEDIKKSLQSAKKRENLSKSISFEIEERWAIGAEQISRAILDFKPNIIHFSGHGAGKKGLCFEDENGNLQFLTGDGLRGLLGLFAANIECVLLNACYSDEQGKEFAEHINYVVGMKDSVLDATAIKFAGEFYYALAAYDATYCPGTPVEFAYEFACKAVKVENLTGDSIPILRRKLQPTLQNPVTAVNSRPMNNVNNDIIKYSGRVKSIICKRLTNDWQDLADYFDIQLHEREGFRSGRQAHGVWEWLEQRNRLAELDSALNDIGRDDLVEELKKN
ncbi:MAG: CHAT domain-containing protein [Cyanobacteria bacterium J06643_5]